MSKGITKSQKRDYKGQHSAIARVIKITEHFFSDLPEIIDKNVADQRDVRYIKYSQAVLICMIIMKNLSGVVTMQAMNGAFNEEAAIKNLARLSKDFDLDEMPDWQTFNDYAIWLDPGGFDKVLACLIKRLLRTKQFYKYTFRGMYPVIFDGTGLAYFKQKHCEHDLVVERTDPTTGAKVPYYYHKVLVAKIVLSPKLVLTIGVEFIENEDENVSKQDCENRAAKRLMQKVHKLFPKLKILMLGDGLYCVEPIMEECEKLGWKYMFNLKEGSQPTICEEFKDMINLKEATTIEHTFGDEDGTIIFANHVEELLLKKQKFNVLQYEYEDADGKKTLFRWATNIKIVKSDAETFCKVGRGRWKIENEGFNFQKNGVFEIEHMCSLNSTGMKIHFLITQIADMIMQLYLAYDKTVLYCKESIKNAARSIFVSFTMQPWSTEIDFISTPTAYHLRD